MLARQVGGRALAAVASAGLSAGPCVTATLPLLGAASREALAEEAARAPSPGHARLIRRYGADAGLARDAAVEASGWSEAELLAPIAPGHAAIPTVWAELFFGITHEGAADVADLLDRRTRVGLVPADREVAVAAAEGALEACRNHR